MPYAKTDWQRTPNAFVFDAFGTESIGPNAIAISQVSTTSQGSLAIPSICKILKVGIVFSSVTTLGVTTSFNLVYNTNPNPGSALGAYLANGPAPNDNSFYNGISNAANLTNYPNQIGGQGLPTNYAVDNQPLFAADITFSVANFPLATTAGGAVGYLVPTNPDAVYPCGAAPVLGPAGFIYPNGYFTLRATTTGAISIANFVATLFYVPITGKEKWGSPTNQNAFPVAGSSAVPGDF